ncbi:unnamed protein product [Ranitomeya imitator]|uniref:Uncharacterized protein n=1 Tax=Ranitomeya imitator TaxID=111125 RepID=A0ABN9M4Q3_9NEOB|nr:unnamed protein product [Ranitomeya imitator]
MAAATLAFRFTHLARLRRSLTEDLNFDIAKSVCSVTAQRERRRRGIRETRGLRPFALNAALPPAVAPPPCRILASSSPAHDGPVLGGLPPGRAGSPGPGGELG